MKISEMQLRDLLREKPLPGLYLDEGEIAAFCKAVVAIEFHEGEKIFAKGEVADWLAIVLDGSLKAAAPDIDANATAKDAASDRVKYSFGDILGAKGFWWWWWWW